VPGAFVAHEIAERVPGSTGKPSDTASKLKQEVAMTAIVQALSRTFHFAHSAEEVDALKQLALFCGVGLLVSLILMSLGVDPSPSLF
jgi:hypothetical protein